MKLSLALLIGFVLGLTAGTIVMSAKAQEPDRSIDFNIGLSQLQPYPADTMPQEPMILPRWTPFQLPCER